MKEEWQLVYEVHYIFFGLAFLSLSGSWIRAMVHARNPPLHDFAKSRIFCAINTALVIFTSSRALLLLLHGYVNDESVPSDLAFDQFLFNIGFPCLIAAYTRTIYPCLESPKHRARCVLAIVLVQCYFFIVAEIIETTVSDGQRICQYINIILSSSSFLFGQCALIFYAKTFFSNSSDVSTHTKNLDGLSVDTVEEATFEMKPYEMYQWSATYREKIATFLILCIWISCVVMRSLIVTGDLKFWDNDIGMDSWYSWIYANVLRIIELGNAAIMSRLVQHITLKPSHEAIWCYT